jgi:hypothetical protein
LFWNWLLTFNFRYAAAQLVHQNICRLSTAELAKNSKRLVKSYIYKVYIIISFCYYLTAMCILYSFIHFKKIMQITNGGNAAQFFLILITYIRNMLSNFRVTFESLWRLSPLQIYRRIWKDFSIFLVFVLEICEWSVVFLNDIWYFFKLITLI